MHGELIKRIQKCKEAEELGHCFRNTGKFSCNISNRI